MALLLLVLSLVFAKNSVHLFGMYHCKTPFLLYRRIFKF